MEIETDILTSYKRIVIKIGSNLLVDDKSWVIRVDFIKRLASEIAELSGVCDITLVCSGAIAAGRTVLGLKERISRQEQQAAAAVGQMVLSKTWGDALSACNVETAQMLLTLQDTESRDHHVNIRETLTQLLKFGVIALINENDTVTQGDLIYGDNDRLAARIATMIKADLLLLLSDIDGLYDSNPHTHKSARHIPLIEVLDDSIFSMAQDRDKLLTSGGMATKLRAAEIAMKGGVDMIIANGRDGLAGLRRGGTYSLFKGQEQVLGARKNWLSGSLRSAGSVVMDDGAMEAVLRNGKSLLLAGVREIIGDFKKGATVDIMGMDLVRCGVGISAYDSDTARQIIGKSGADVEAILGSQKPRALIHRNDLVLL